MTKWWPLEQHIPIRHLQVGDIDVLTGHVITELEVLPALGVMRSWDAGGYLRERTLAYPRGGIRYASVIVPGPMPSGYRVRGIPGDPVLAWPKRPRRGKQQHP